MNKRQKFLATIEPRVNRVLDALKQLKQTADKRYHDYSPGEAEMVMAAIGGAVTEVGRAFIQEAPGPFKLVLGTPPPEKK